VFRWSALVLVAGIRVAAAEPDDIIGRPLVLGQGQVDAELTAEISLSSLQAGAPTSLAPDLWYGVLPELTIGLIHSDLSVDRISPGASVCINTVRMPITNSCFDRYHNVGLDVLYSMATGSFAAAAHARFLLREFEPVFKPAVTVGATLRWHHGRWSITGDPYLQLGLANRPDGNRAELWLPVVLAVQPSPRVAIQLYTGWNSDLAVWTDGYYVPGAIGVRVRATRNVDAGATFGFPSILGPQNDEKSRVLFFDVGWRS
jgi:hypothetical protein